MAEGAYCFDFLTVVENITGVAGSAVAHVMQRTNM